MSCDSKTQPDLHSARVPLDRDVQEGADTGKIDDSVEPPGDVISLHPKDCGAEVDVLAPGQLWVEACAHFEQGAHATPELSGSGRRLSDSGEYLQERRLARAVSSY